MKRLFAIMAFALLVVPAGIARAEGPDHPVGGLGFHNSDAPVGVRWWLNEKVALDAGIGIGSDEVPGLDENLSHWTVDIGVPIMLRSWDRVHFMARPGIAFGSQEVITDVGPPVEKDDDKTTSFGIELEAEVFLADKVSVSASHGFRIVNSDPAGGSSTTSWGTTGANFTELGFHVYLFGEH